jgi:hypothetical protein
MTPELLAQLLVIATQLVTQIEAIKNQTAAENADVWNTVSTQYASALAGWNAVVATTAPVTGG